MQQTLEQIRATHALDDADSVTDRVKKKAVTRLPAMILTNGLLATAAFALDKEEELLTAMNSLAEHLRKTEKIAIPPEAAGGQRPPATARNLLDDLKGRDSVYLRLATTEALSYLAFLKRFARE